MAGSIKKTNWKTELCICLAAVLLPCWAWQHWLAPRPGAQKQPGKSAHAHPYRTVTSINGNGELLPYEFHPTGQTRGLKEFCAIIKRVDPARDDYKNYCRTVINDIVSSAETDMIKVYIFDSYESYAYSELDLDEDLRALSRQQADSMDAHLVAVYSGDIGYYDDNYIVRYYEDAHNKYTETEDFKPVAE